MNRRLVLVLLSLFNVPTDGLIFTSASSDVLAATQPLQRKIDSLTEKLDTLEGRHDTLEAATEQFRLQSKSLKSKLDIEKVRYDELMFVKVDLESKHAKEVDDLTLKLQAAKKQGAIAEQALEEALSVHRSKEVSFHKDLSSHNIELSSFKGRYEESKRENKKLKTLLREKDAELAEARGTYHKLRQELFVANEQLGEYEQSAKLTMWKVLMDLFRNSRVSELLKNGTSDSWEVVYQMVPRVRSNLDECVKTAVDLWARRTEMVKLSFSMDTLQSVGIMFLDIKGSFKPQLLANFSSPELVRVKEDMEQMFSTHIAEPTSELRAYLADLHAIGTLFLEGALVEGLNYYTKYLGGSQGDFVHTACLQAQAHTSMILVGLEIVAGILAIHLGMALLHLLSRNNSAPKTIPVRRRASSPTLGLRPNASLLRTAGGLSRRQ